jgi:hypothetical protein
MTAGLGPLMKSSGVRLPHEIADSTAKQTAGYTFAVLTKQIVVQAPRHWNR